MTATAVRVACKNYKSFPMSILLMQYYKRVVAKYPAAGYSNAYIL